jgi:hypothetical protein
MLTARELSPKVRSPSPPVAVDDDNFLFLAFDPLFSPDTDGSKETCT